MVSAQPDLSVVFPVFNEEENIPILLDEIAAAMRGQPWSYEMVAVDDGSRDRSLEVLRRSRTNYPNLRVLTFEKNSGQTAALDAAWRAARGKYVVSLDADLQNDPADIPTMMRQLEESDADMVIGAVLVPGGMPDPADRGLRRGAIPILKRVANRFNVWLPQ